MVRTRLIQLICLMLAAAVLASAMPMQDRLDSMRQSMDLSIGEGVSKDYPELKLLEALPGGLRAVLIDYLWIRSEKLKQKGKYFDLVQLANMICTLEARFPGVWGYHAWNLAYNVSVEKHTPAERWYWINAGIQLPARQGVEVQPQVARSVPRAELDVFPQGRRPHG